MVAPTAIPATVPTGSDIPTYDQVPETKYDREFTKANTREGFYFQRPFSEMMFLTLGHAD